MTTHNCVLSIPCKHNVIVKKKKLDYGKHIFIARTVVY